MSEPVFYSPQDALAYLAECLLATVEGLPKRASGYERKRHVSIAQTAVRACVQFNAGNNPSTHMYCSRLEEQKAAMASIAKVSR